MFLSHSIPVVSTVVFALHTWYILYRSVGSRLPGNSGLFEVTQSTCDLATISVPCTDKLPFDPWGSNVVYSEVGYATQL